MCALALFIGLGVLDCVLKERAPAQYLSGVMPEGPERERFHKLLKKHGLQYDVAVIHDWPSDPWYRDQKGRRIKLK